MSVWTKRRGRQLIALLLMTGLLALVGTLVAYADSTPGRSAGVWDVQSRPEAVATATVAPPVNVIVNGGFEDGFVQGIRWNRPAPRS